MLRYTKLARGRAMGQTLPIPGADQVRNDAGGFVWALDAWGRLDRFLILGTEGGTYYVSEQELNDDHVDTVLACLELDGPRVVERIATISREGRAPKNDPALFALALCASVGDEATRRLALLALSEVARTGTHLFHFLEYADGFRGWGRGLRRAVGAWYNERLPEQLAHQLMKYRQRDGWSHRDALRLAHPRPFTMQHEALYHWATHGHQEKPGREGLLPDQLYGFAKARRTSSRASLCGLIKQHRLPREAIPTPWLQHADVWEALLPHMPLEAMIRNLATMARTGLLRAGSPAVEPVRERLADAEAIQLARLHPIKILAALMAYGSGRSRHRLVGGWKPRASIVGALDRAFYHAFRTTEPSGQRMVLAIDVSGSMDDGCVGGVAGLTPRVASAALALLLSTIEPACHMVAFSHRLVPFQLAPGQRLEKLVERFSRIPMGGTDCAQPMLWALEHQVAADAFVVLTDNETWAGPVHPVQALQRYRDATGIAAKLVVVGMTATGFSIADPRDRGMLDVVGFDTAVPELISNFLAGRV